MQSEQIVQLDPAKVQTADNVRFNLKKYRVDALKESIVSAGGVMTPVEVEPLEKPANGYTHRLTAGYYRHAAVSALNKEGAGLTLPAIVRSTAGELDRVKRQISENRDRENMSPMDEAIAIKRLLDMGVSKAEVARVFARPGGRKGLAMQPASNAHLNMMLSFLELPKAIQSKIHDGLVGVAAAYELTKVPAEKREEILAKAEAERQREIDREEREEERLAKAEARSIKEAQREQERASKVEAAVKAVDDAAAEEAEAKAAVKIADAAFKEAKKTPANYLELPKEEQQAIAQKVADAKKAQADASKRLVTAQKQLQKAKAALSALTEQPAEKPAPKAKAEPKAAAKAPAKVAKVGPADIRKAAKDAGVESKPAPLTAAEAKDAMAFLADSKLPKVRAIGTILGKVLAGETTIEAALTELSIITGERKK